MIKTELVMTVYDPIKFAPKGTYSICELPRIELTDDDIGLVLDALYEQATYNENATGTKTKYSKALRKVAKKFEKCAKELDND